MRVDLTFDGRTELEKLRKVMFLIIEYIGFPMVGLISPVAIRNIIYILHPPSDSHMARGTVESNPLL
jgi:hypothetical protein